MQSHHLVAVCSIAFAFGQQKQIKKKKKIKKTANVSPSTNWDLGFITPAQKAPFCRLVYSMYFRRLVFEHKTSYCSLAPWHPALPFLSQFFLGTATVFSTQLTRHSDSLSVLHTERRKFIYCITFQGFCPLLQPFYPPFAVPSRSKYSTSHQGTSVK